MIKKWNQFNESMAEKPGANVPGSVKITISDEEVNSFSDEPALSKLIYDDKVSLLGNEVWYLENDDQTKAILDQYLEVPGKNELEEITENLAADLNKETILHILKLKVEEVMGKKVDYEIWDFDDQYKGHVDGNSYRAYKFGREKAFREVLDMIKDFEKDS